MFKYAGSVYKDLGKLEVILESGGDPAKAFRAYAKHWGELKGFALALQTGRDNLGETAVRLNRIIGFGPVLLNLSQVTDIDSQGNYVKDESKPPRHLPVRHAEAAGPHGLRLRRRGPARTINLPRWSRCWRSSATARAPRTD